SLKETNWNQVTAPIAIKLSARSRYREDLQEIVLINHSTVEFKNEQSTLSSGQSLVVYHGEACLGGGVIE
ncbi:MAG: tRNA methyl transferase, partial [Bacteroidota bacterium]